MTGSPTGPFEGSTWRLPSNDGRDELGARLLGVDASADDPLLRAEFGFRGRCWSPPAHPEGIVDPDVLVIALPLVEIPAGSVETAYARIHSWLEAPRAMRVHLVREPGSALSIALAPVGETIWSVEKPDCRMSFRQGHFLVRVRFRVDESCVRLLAEGLRDWVRAARFAARARRDRPS